MTDEPNLDVKTLRGDVRDALLSHIRALPKPWAQMSEAEQDDAIYRASALAEKLVRDAVDLAGARGFEHHIVSLGKYSIDKGVEGKFTAPYSAQLVDALGTRRGSTFLLVPRDIGDFLGERQPVKAEPDQRQFFNTEDDGDFPPEEGEDEGDDPEPDESDVPAPPSKRSKDYERIRDDAGL